MSGNFDHTYGGFGTAPKFPPHRGLALMLARYRATRDENLLRMATLTFDRMACGGMYDQIGGGFHRYSTDAKWLVPHFEKMLYDNALLADAYLDAWQATGRDLYQRVARETFDWVLREMTDEGGAFYSTLDADSEGEEGRFYVWRPDEVAAVLGPKEAPLFCEYYGITPRGNFEGGASIPNVQIPLAQLAERKGASAAELGARLESGRRLMLAARNHRARPHLDDKILTAWNGLMIAALARGAGPLDTLRYLDAAARAADFLLKNLRGADGLMRVSYRKGQVNAEGFLDDQAFFLRALLALHEATGDARWLREALALAKNTEASFKDTAAGGYFFTPPGKADLIVRSKSPTDGAIPSGNSMMAASFLALHRATGDAAWRARAAEVFSAFGGSMEAMPGAFHSMLAALDLYTSGGGVPPANSATPPVRVTVVSSSPSGAIAGAGGTAQIEIRLDIPEGWHVNSSKPTLPYLIPTSVSLAPGGPVSLGGVDYPEGRMVTLGFAGKPISVYEGRQTIRLRVTVDPSAPAGPLTVRGSVTSQACSQEACQLPSQKSFETVVTKAP